MTKRTVAAGALRASGVGSLLRRLGAWEGALVLTYHRIGAPDGQGLDAAQWNANASGLAAQVALLRRHCEIVAPRELEDALGRRGGRFGVLTFDDGFRDNHALALPVLRAAGVPAGFYIPTGFLDAPTVLPGDEIAWMVRASGRSATAGAALTRELQGEYRAQPGERGDAFLEELGRRLGVGRCPPEVVAGAYLDWDMVRELHASGMEVGGHSVTHPMLGSLAPERQRWEIAESRRRLTAELGEAPLSFAYPYGDRRSFTAVTKAILREEGFRLAFSFYGGFQPPGGLDPLDVPRVAATTGTTPPVLEAMLALPQRFARAAPSQRAVARAPVPAPAAENGGPRAVAAPVRTVRIAGRELAGRDVADHLRWRARPLLGAVRRNLPGRRPRWGNLRRLRPFSDEFGFDRGTPVDRVYIERFLEAHRACIFGDVLEVQEPGYTRRYGGIRVRREHVVDIDAGNPRATIVADLCAPGSLPAAAYDCAIVTETLQLLADEHAALRNLHHALRPGGTLLLTIPCLSRQDPEAVESDRWRMLPLGLAERLARACPDAEIHVEGHGNLLASIAFLAGLAAEELRPAELDADDAAFPLIACARLTKPVLLESVPGSPRPEAAARVDGTRGRYR
jgi:peptidoglycan/xylan/chitin deacetylase (PgdA/CDA1 family)